MRTYSWGLYAMGLFADFGIFPSPPGLIKNPNLSMNYAE